MVGGNKFSLRFRGLADFGHYFPFWVTLGVSEFTCVHTATAWSLYPFCSALTVCNIQFLVKTHHLAQAEYEHIIT